MNLQLTEIFNPKIKIIGFELEPNAITGSGKKDVFALKRDAKIDSLAKSFHIREDLLEKLNNNESVLFYDNIPVDNIGNLSMILQSLKEKGIECVASKSVINPDVWQYGYCKNLAPKIAIVNGWIITKRGIIEEVVLKDDFF